MTRPRYREEAPFKIHGGCGLVGICELEGTRMGAEPAVRAMAVQRERGNGLGGGFSAYGIYPEYADLFCFHLMYHDERAKQETEALLVRDYLVHHAEPIPTRPAEGIVEPPLLWRYFVDAGHARLETLGLSVEDYVVGTVMHINDAVDGAFVASSGKNMGAFKGVGYPEEVAHFYRLEEYAGHTWLGHNRFPTNTPGWWGGAHPFALLDWSVVHNGEISSYGINQRYLAGAGYRCTLGTDTEVVAYLFDLLVRQHGLPLELACAALASPLWSEIDRLPVEEQAVLQALRSVYGPAMLNGPFAIVVGFNGGMVALNDRVKLRPLVAGRQDSVMVVASEESALREVLDTPDEVWAPRAGEPVIVRQTRAAGPDGARTGHAVQAGAPDGSSPAAHTAAGVAPGPAAVATDATTPAGQVS